MKKLKILLFLLVSAIALNSYSQFESIETLPLGYIWDGIPSDVDQDGDLDMLLYASLSQSVFWRENVSDDFETNHEIVSGGHSVISMKAGDLDGDGDVDFATLGSYGLWFFENTDGQGTFTEGTLLSDSVTGSEEVYIVDIDLDGDQDILLRYDYYLTNKLSWFENIDNTLEFEAESTIYDPSEAVSALCCAKLNEDQYMDMVVGFNDSIVCLNNFINGSFASSANVTTNVNGVMSLRVADLNGDNHRDILAASYYDLKLCWYENSGSGTFGSQQLLTNNNLYGHRLLPVDLDNDEDIDLIGISIVGEYFKNMFFYENTGSGNFSSPQNIVETAAISEVFLGDVDNDNDVDIFTLHRTDMFGAGSFGLNKNQLYTVGVFDEKIERVQTYPNPVTDELTILFEGSNNSSFSIELYDISGKQVYAKSDITPANSCLDLSVLNNGLYIGKLISTENHEVIKELKVVIQR